jgi:hypothetical protein
MTLKQLIYTMATATLVCWLAWIVIVTQINPTADGAGGLLMFYAVLFFAILGSLFLISFKLRKILTKEKDVLEYRLVAVSFRQSIFLTILIIGILILQSQSFLNWWNLILIILALTIIEGFMLSVKRTI